MTRAEEWVRSALGRSNAVWHNAGLLGLLNVTAAEGDRRGVALLAATVPVIGTSWIGSKSGRGATSRAGRFASGDRAFFEAPDPLPAGEHGDLVRWQVVEASFTHRYRIMYLSETVAGQPTVVTALVEAPEDIAPFGG